MSKSDSSVALIFRVMVNHSVRVLLNEMARAMSFDCVDLSNPPSIPLDEIHAPAGAKKLTHFVAAFAHRGHIAQQAS